MIEPRWLPIEYRDFYDLPRMVIVGYGEHLYLFDSPFDERADEYAAYFTIYRLPSETSGRLHDPSWVDLPDLGEVIARVATDEVDFDPSKRRFVSDAVFRRLGID